MKNTPDSHNWIYNFYYTGVQKEKINVLITGASGFIGTHLTSLLFQKNYKVYIIGRTSSASKYNPSITTFYHDFTPTGINHCINTAVNTINSPFYFIHNAGVKFSVNPDDYYRVNYEYTRNLIEALKPHQNLVKKFILISSLSARGPLKKNSLNTDNPISHYGKSKLMAENFCRKSNLPHLILRITAVYGEGDPDFLFLFNLIKKNKFIIVPGFEKKYLTFIHVNDLLKIITKAMEEPHLTGTYYISDGHIYEFDDFIKTIENALGVRRIIIKIPSALALILSKLLSPFVNIKLLPSYLAYDRVREFSSDDWSCDSLPVLKATGIHPTDIYNGLPLLLYNTINS